MGKLIINLSMLGKNPTGLGIYSKECATRLEKAINCVVVSSYHKSDSYRNIKSPEDVAIGAPNGAAFKRILYLWKGFPNINGLVYSPSHHGLIGRNNQIITILDLIPIHQPSQHKFQYYYFKYILPRILKRCRAVFTISENAKQDIVLEYGVNPSDIYVVPCGIDTSLFKKPDIEVEADKFLLVVGASYPHKNIEELLENWQLWKGRYSLKIASCRGKQKKHLERLVKDYDLTEDVTFLGYISNDDLVTLYQNCSALVFPSKWEGFGMPPLEALACGRPSIISDIPVHREVMGDSALYVLLGNKESWRRAFTLLEDQDYILSILEKGGKAVEKYTWDNSGKILINSILSVEPKLRQFLNNDIECNV